MKKLGWFLLALTGPLLGLSVTAQAKSNTRTPYIWVSSKKVRPYPTYFKLGQPKPMWNRAHTKKIHNLQNYPRTTWIVQRKIVLQSPSKSHDTYYEVRSANKKVHGYVWHGNLSKGVNPNHVTAGTLAGPPGYAVEKRLIDAHLNQQLASLFPGTVADKKLQLSANMLIPSLTMSDGVMNCLAYYFDDASEDVLTFSANTKIAKSANFLKAQRRQLGGALKQAGLTFSSFDHYRIGAYAYPKNHAKYGESVIYLLAPTIR
ncbi:hypothetical protein [Levilactobacillus tongjiangensis]|uniref:D-alanyl-D-alanine carboxypeptidase n=1 Tax=Levilactobacillus tongjiangensis TaxID=2486023 RepID=A0ABW1SUS6_9LACO|nr:hypothetical protein [Levilactobacillus tongjiangensis]